MKLFKSILTLLLCAICFISVVSCGKSELNVPHTHTLTERHVKAPNCYSNGYYETYCEYCSYSVKIDDNTLGEHVYKSYYDVDVEPGYNTPGISSRHCTWFDHCGKFIDAKETAPKPEEDFPPADL